VARKAGSKNGVRKVVPKDIPEKQVATVDRGPPASFSDADAEYEAKRPKKSKDGKINSIAGLIQRYHELAGK
jgi:hypothetical protein